MSRVLDILARSSLYQQLGTTSLARVCEHAALVRAGRGEPIFMAGEPCPGVYVVGQGAVRLVRMAPSGKQHVLRFVEEGGSFGEAAVIRGFAAPVSAYAHADVECVCVAAPAFRALLEADHALCLEVMASMAGRVHQLVDLLEDMVLRDAAGRVARYLLALPDAEGWLTLPVLKHELAAHLGLTSETLSRTLRRLVEHGLLELAGERLRVCERARIAEVAQQGLP